jgi:hypothetical protein
MQTSGGLFDGALAYIEIGHVIAVDVYGLHGIS